MQALHNASTLRCSSPGCHADLRRGISLGAAVHQPKRSTGGAAGGPANLLPRPQSSLRPASTSAAEISEELVNSDVLPWPPAAPSLLQDPLHAPRRGVGPAAAAAAPAAAPPAPLAAISSTQPAAAAGAGKRVGSGSKQASKQADSLAGAPVERTDRQAAAPAAAAAAAAAEDGVAGNEPYTLVKKVALAGGVLDLVRLEGERMLRVWMPPGYSREEAAHHPLPLLLLNDGQNLFDDRLSFSGCSWRAGETAAKLITSGQLPPFLVAGIDHAGPDRSLDYLPYKPGSGPGNFRKDAAQWPGGGVAAYMERVVDEILPWLGQTYGAATDAAHVAFGGSSFGGICTLWACMRYPDRFGAALVESPSLWFADEKFLREDLQQYSGPWPHRLFLAMGSQEYSGIRAEAKDNAQWDQLLVRYCRQLAELLASRGLDADRLMWQIDEGATHTERAWAQRLPQALPFLLQPWWADAVARHTAAGSLYFTTPRKLQAGQPAVLFVNKSRSHALAGHSGSLHIKMGFNNWTLGSADLQLQPAPQLDLQQQQQQQQQQEGQQLPGAAGVLAKAGRVAAAAAGGEEAMWQLVSFTVPAEAYEMHFVLTDGNGTWDNNAGSDFYIRVKQSQSSNMAAAAWQSPEEAVAAARAAAEGPVDEVASRSGSKLYFTAPETPVAGAPAVLYFNRARSWPLQHNPNVKVHLGFNHFEAGAQDLQLRPTSLWRGEGVDWWATEPFQVPEGAFDVSFAFTDGHGAWDSNDGLNYSAPVWQPAQRREAVAAAPRTIASTEVVDHAGGKLHIINLSRRAATDKASKESRWKEEKVLRVWTPPGYSKEAAPPGGWPALWMNDGQNMYEDWLAHQGHAWNVGHCAAGLIAGGVVPPFVVVAVDSAGPMRSLNYLPYKPGTGLGGFRGDAERWPGGGCEAYMQRLVHELMPLVQDTFATATDPARVAFGGGSFAGVTALYAALHYPHVFGSVLAESPSLWIAEGRFLQDLWAYSGPLPERLFMGCGTKEYSATRDHDRDDVDALLLHYYCEAARALEAAGMRGGQRLRFLVEEDAGHHELAWQWRLTGALTFLLSPWWDE